MSPERILLAGSLGLIGLSTAVLLVLRATSRRIDAAVTWGGAR